MVPDHLRSEDLQKIADYYLMDQSPKGALEDVEFSEELSRSEIGDVLSWFYDVVSDEIANI